ncbi:unnamed protein product, partial [marine sediment metagenome]
VWRVHPDGPRSGVQGFRLLLNETQANHTVGLGYVMVSATAYNGLGAGALWGAALTTPKELLAGVAMATVADDEWGWYQVYGAASIIETGADTADGALVESAADGEVTDTVGTGVILGFALEAETTNVAFSVFINIVDLE